MATSIQRLLIMVFAINLVMGSLQYIYYNPTSYDSSSTDLLLSQYEDRSGDGAEIDLETSTKDKTNTDEGFIGASLKAGKIIVSIFLTSVDPFPFNADTQLETQAEKIVGTGISFIRIMMWILLILEMFFMFWSRKST